MGCGGGRRYRGYFGYDGCSFPGHLPWPGEFDGYYPLDEKERLKEDLKLLYAGGQISRADYQEALHELALGRFTAADLAVLRRAETKGSSPAERQEKTAGRTLADNKAAAQVEQLQAEKERVVRARAETEEFLQDLTKSIAELKENMQRDEMLARSIVNKDDDQAKGYLAHRLETAKQVGILESQAQELQNSLQRLEQMEQTLAAKILALTAQERQERLINLEQSLQG